MNGVSAMNGLILAFVVASGGIETTWEKNEEGEVVYVVQLDDQAISALKQGYSITSALPDEVSQLKSIRLQYGNRKLHKPALITPVDESLGTAMGERSSIVLASHPAQQSPLSPAGAYRQNETGSQINYPDRGRPLAATVAGSSATPQGSAPAVSGGTFAAPLPSIPAARIPEVQQAPIETPADPRTTYDGQSLLSNGQVNPLGVPSTSSGFDDTQPIRLPPGHGVLAPQWHSVPADNLGAASGFSPNARGPMMQNDFSTAQGSTAQGSTLSDLPPSLPTSGGAINTIPRQPESQDFRLPGPVAFQANPVNPRTDRQVIAPPPLLSGTETQWQNGNSRPSGNQGTATRVQGGSVLQNQSTPNGYAISQESRSIPAAATTPARFTGGIQPIPASNQPINTVDAGFRTRVSQVTPATAQPVRSQQTTETSWWELVNRQDSQASADSGSRLAQAISAPIAASTNQKTGPSAPPSSVLPKSSSADSSLETASTPKDNRFGIMGLLFLSVGLNAYMGFLLRGFYVKSRQLARDLRESIATA